MTFLQSRQNRPGKTRFSVLAIGLALGVAAIAGCRRLPPSKPLSELTAQEAAGRRIFLGRCSGCHYSNSERGLHGPGLLGLFRKPYLPSGTRANDQRVTEAILHGRNQMPALGDTLNDQQLEELLAYLHTL